MLRYVVLLSCLLIPVVGFADRVQYEFTFDSTWDPTVAEKFPNNVHFSGVYGATHNSDFTYWQSGQFATPGIQQIAELGTNTIAQAEVLAAIESGTALTEVNASAGAVTPKTVVSRFSTFTSHPLVSVATMIAPSPDWFVGVSNVNLHDEHGNWLPEVRVDVHPYDAGTDSGPEFRSGDLVSDPFEPISRITAEPFEDLQVLGSFSFRLLTLPGDVNGSGEVDAGDLETLCFRLGRSLPNADQAGDPDLIELDDVHALVERVMGTRLGDANLDGKVDFDDFLNLSGNFGGTASWEGGDFDCNRQVDFSDFLALSSNFGFDRDGAGVAAVPEPSGWPSLLLGLCVLRFCSRKK